MKQQSKWILCASRLQTTNEKKTERNETEERERVRATATMARKKGHGDNVTAKCKTISRCSARVPWYGVNVSSSSIPLLNVEIRNESILVSAFVFQYDAALAFSFSMLFLRLSLVCVFIVQQVLILYPLVRSSCCSESNSVAVTEHKLWTMLIRYDCQRSEACCIRNGEKQKIIFLSRCRSFRTVFLCALRSRLPTHSIGASRHIFHFVFHSTFVLCEKLLLRKHTFDWM